MVGESSSKTVSPKKTTRYVFSSIRLNISAIGFDRAFLSMAHIPSRIRPSSSSSSSISSLSSLQSSIIFTSGTAVDVVASMVSHILTYTGSICELTSISLLSCAIVSLLIDSIPPFDMDVAVVSRESSFIRLLLPS